MKNYYTSLFILFISLHGSVYSSKAAQPKERAALFQKVLTTIKAHTGYRAYTLAIENHTIAEMWIKNLEHGTSHLNDIDCMELVDETVKGFLYSLDSIREIELYAAQLHQPPLPQASNDVFHEKEPIAPTDAQRGQARLRHECNMREKIARQQEKECQQEEKRGRLD